MGGSFNQKQGKDVVGFLPEKLQTRFLRPKMTKECQKTKAQRGSRLLVRKQAPEEFLPTLATENTVSRRGKGFFV